MTMISGAVAIVLVHSMVETFGLFGRDAPVKGPHDALDRVSRVLSGVPDGPA